MSMSFTIRTAELSDLEEIYTIEIQCFQPVDRFEKDLYKILLSRNDSVLFILAVLEGKYNPIIGYVVALQKAINNFDILTLNVHPNYRRKGIGHNLMIHIEYLAQKKVSNFLTQNPNRLISHLNFELMVYEKNESAKSLYVKLGYESKKIVRNYYPLGRNGIKMIKQIPLEK